MVGKNIMQFKILGFTFSFSAGIFWFRDRDGYGLFIVDRNKIPPSFSERNGLKKTVTYKRLSIKELKPMSNENDSN